MKIDRKPFRASIAVAPIMVAMAAAGAFLASSEARADLILIESASADSTEGLGAFSGSIDYTPDAPDTGLLTVMLTNTSDPANGGFITGFVFNADSVDPAIDVSLISGSHPFTGLTNAPAPPFDGPFTAGAALGGNWVGGGNPNAGIAVGETGTFEFSVHATDAADLTPLSFMTASGSFDFIVRMRGFADGGSDKIPATIPGPASLALLGIGLLAPRRRHRGSDVRA